MSDYRTFLARKSHAEGGDGFAPVTLNPALFDFQSHLVTWALRKGRSAIFAECGLGKTLMQLAWADNVVRFTNRPVLILAPLAVTNQTAREADKFGIEAVVSMGGAPPSEASVVVTNYEKLHRFDPADFVGVVADESGILKSFDGTTRAAVTQFMRPMRYRLLCTATPSPNDYIEMGTSSEALGSLGFMDMLARFFKNNRNTAGMMSQGKQAQWRFKGHAEKPFWRWVCSWARCIRSPADLGFDAGGFVLPGLRENTHVVSANRPREGMLFTVPAVGLQEEREERRRTLKERCERMAALVADTGQAAVCWGHLNDEADLVEKLIPGAVQVSGRDSDEAKVEKFDAFATGQARVLVTKPIIGAWGLNWQHCAHTVMFTGHSFEQYYQSVRRFLRFGQSREVVVDHVCSDGEARVIGNLRRKSEQADKLFAEVVRHMQDELAVNHTRNFTQTEELPSWL